MEEEAQRGAVAGHAPLQLQRQWGKQGARGAENDRSLAWALLLGARPPPLHLHYVAAARILLHLPQLTSRL